jgi:hypothetical protein
MMENIEFNLPEKILRQKSPVLTPFDSSPKLLEAQVELI